MTIALVSKAERRGGALANAVASRALANAGWIGVVLLLIFTATVTAAAILFPLVQWDMIAYVATILEKTVSDPQLLHEQVYRTVQGAVSHGEFLVLTEDRPYRAVQYSDPAAFYSMLGFYRVKWLYIEAISAMAQFLPPVSAIRAVSAISAAGVGLTVLAWLAWAGRLAWAPLAMAHRALNGLVHLFMQQLRIGDRLFQYRRHIGDHVPLDEREKNGRRRYGRCEEEQDRDAQPACIGDCHRNDRARSRLPALFRFRDQCDRHARPRFHRRLILSVVFVWTGVAEPRPSSLRKNEMTHAIA
jgi:hypothetical protein